jgi:hypothetical protein
MNQGEQFIIQPRDSHLKKDVCKIKVLENTRTTIFFQVEEGHEKVRLLHSDFEKDYRIIEKIEKTLKLNTELYGSTNDLQQIRKEDS